MKTKRIRLTTPFALSALIVATGIFSRSPLVDAMSGRSVAGFSLRTPPGYFVFAPLSNLFDGLTLLSLPQVFSAFGFVCVVAAALRYRAVRDRARNDIPPFRISEQIRFAATIVGAIVAIAGLALLMPRSMAGIGGTNQDLVTIDFHSHTSASHDGRPSFTPEENREWHRKAGFDVAYITDHHTFAGARAAMSANPAIAGEGTVLLPGLEYRDGDEHVIALGLDISTTDPERREWHPLYAGDTTAGRDAPTLLILSLPGNVKATPVDEEIGVARLAAIELSDGSPRGIGQAARDRREILSLAERRHLSVVSGSDNHGWGRTAAAWTVMRIPGWRLLRPAQLDAAIRSRLAESPSISTSVIARRMPPAATATAIALTGPELAWEIARDIGWYERLSWIVWIWSGWGCLLIVHRRRINARTATQDYLPGAVSGAAIGGGPRTPGFV